MNWIKQGLKNFLIIALSSMLLIEFVGLFVKDNQYFWDKRFLFISDKNFVARDNGLWTYKPNTKIRSIATYKFSFTEAWIEYDCSFNTNEFGLIDTNFEAGMKNADYLVLGDSFTEGHGGCSWLTKETVTGQEKVIINGGLMGVGVRSFLELERWLSTQVKIENVVVIAISNDFYRGIANDWIKQGEKCFQERQCTFNDYWWAVDSSIFNDTHKIKQISDERYGHRFTGKDEKNELIKEVSFYSTIFYAIHKYLTLVREAPAKSDVDAFKIKQLDLNIAALKQLKARYPNLKLMLVPQRDELSLFGSKNMDTQILESRLAQDNIQYSVCDLSISDFMYIDGHPSSRGYDKVRMCLFDLFDEVN